MKKSKLLLSTLLVGAIVVSGCSSKEETKSTTESSSSSSSNKTETSKDKVYGLNEDWVVDGQWKLKIDNVTTTTERNQFSEDNPAQVVVITYTYENLGYTGEIQDLFFTPKQVVDEGKKVAKLYPAGAKKYPSSVPEGTIMEGAQEAYGLITESKTIKVIFEKYDNNKKIQKATFEVPVK